MLKDWILIRNAVALVSTLLLSGSGLSSQAQGVPQVGERVEFAGVTIYISQTNRQFLQQEVEMLYINRPLVSTKVEQMVMYFPIIEPMLNQAGIPDDFKYLALEDSSLVTSADRSVGLWSITKANPLGLQVTPTVDERLHLLLATETATQRLKSLHQQTDNWIEALHLYNHPATQSTNSTAVPKADSPTAYALNEATDEQLIRLLAHKLVLERALPVYRPQRPLVLYPYADTKNKTLTQLADFFRVTPADVVLLNRWVKSDRVPADKEYTVFISTPLEQYIEVKRRAGIVEGNQTAWQDMGFPVLRKLTKTTGFREPVFYQINNKKGIQAQLYDNKITLAYKADIKVKNFQKYNDLKEEQVLYAGDIFYIEKKDKRGKVPYHVVRRGQTLWDVSQQYGIQMQALAKNNEIGPTERLLPGRVLWLQQKRPRSKPVEYYRLPAVQTPEPVIKEETTTLAQAPPKPDTTRTVSQKIDSTSVTSRATRILDSILVASSNATKTIKPASSTPPAAVTVTKKAVAPKKAPEQPLLIHTIERGETYLMIANRYGVTVQQLFDWNNLTWQDRLQAGKQLMIDLSKKTNLVGTFPTTRPAVNTPKKAVPNVKPAPSVKPATAPVTRPTPTPSARPAAAPAVKPVPVAPPVAPKAIKEPLIHIVQPGENLYRIGLRYKVSPALVAKWNSIQNNVIEVGQRIIIYQKQ
ncbi:LysM peptidoglycan-binding domain-containing protein [Tellurirhabdus bombi]|uniref:LysM peptidoglycan-binding domain-containing protein n=1 Tax=Tellurirhabdus bombi TaxID=2907205 RepID=UPI001F43013A|nr:LysM peptidoglycan-binding domain-containing protein [Tellurirhabdus bombi]